MPAIKVPIERLRKRIASFRCSAAEYQQLEDAAARADVPLSDWLRTTTLEIASGDRWPAPGTVLKVGDGEVACAGSREVVNPVVMAAIADQDRILDEIEDAVLAEIVRLAVTIPRESAGDTAAELSSEVAIAATPEEDILKAYMGPAVEAVSRQMEADVLNMYAQFELPLTWADHWALMERMEPGEATERLYELAAGRKFPDGFPRWSKARKLAWLEATWPLVG